MGTWKIAVPRGHAATLRADYMIHDNMIYILNPNLVTLCVSAWSNDKMNDKIQQIMNDAELMFLMSNF